MAQFLKETAISTALESIIDRAEGTLILISPFIKLTERLRDQLKRKSDNPDLELVIVFGKNPDDPGRSINLDDLAFFKEFPNVVIKYKQRLHAKYYANEKESLLTSMNLYEHSIVNNIEFGILTKTPSVLGQFVTGASLDEEAYHYFQDVIEGCDSLFEKRPVFEKKTFGLQRQYTHSEIMVDLLNEFMGKRKASNTGPRTPQRPKATGGTGYCIRTGVEIPFNPKRPMAADAYKSWSRYKNADYPEKYCHRTGQASNGKTSMSRPVLEA